MKINLNIKSIILEDETEVDVETIENNEDGIKFYINDILEKIHKDFDIQTAMLKTVELSKLKIKTKENKIYTLFDCFYTVRENEEKLYIHLIFKEIIKKDIDVRNFKCDKLIVKFDYDIFKKTIFSENINFSVNDINFSHNINKNEVCISSNSIKERDKLYSFFIDYFELINLIVGYFPTIIQTTYMSGLNEIIVENDTVDKYFTSYKYKKNIFSFFQNLSSGDIEEKYIKYRDFSQKAKLQLDMYFMITMKKNSYLEVDVVNILQTLDGLYDKLTIFEKKQISFSNKMKKEIIKYIKTLNFSTINEKYDSTLDINQKIIDYIQYMNHFTYREKLRNIFEYDNNLLFEEENKQDNKPFIAYNVFINKCVNSRNRLSHVDEKDDIFLEKENIVYIYKLLLIFRLLVLQEIELISKINQEKLKICIEELNNYIRESL